MDELSEAELRYYNDLFKICSETDSGGKVPALKATSLFRSANLSNETINKITSLVGIPQTALYLSRQQFYGCLKLIAAYQASVPLREEILTTSLNLPLPQFSWIDPVVGPPSATSTSDPVVSNATAGGVASSGATERNGFVEGKHHRPGGSNITAVKHLPLVPSSGGSGSGQQQDSSASTGGELTNSDQPSTDSEVEHNDDGSGIGSMIRGDRERHTVGMLKGGGVVMVGGTHPAVGGGGGGGAGGSPEAWSTASDSPTPTNSVAERPWANQNLWQGLVCEEQRQLLGTEEESSDRHSSDDDEQEIDLEYFYQISQTQKDYYLKQFRTIQPDIHGLVSGPVARVFFEKSRIPIDELRHIWQMCDVTRDGALNLAEFTAAMHLVVLRRNNIPVPATLPPCLLPTLLQHSLLQPSTSGSKGAGPAEVSATTVSGGSNGTATVPERTEPAEADLLHLESDDNLESGSKRKRVVTKSSRRMVPVPDSLAFAKIGGSGSAGVVPVPQDSPPCSVSSSATGSGSVALATKGSGSSSGSSGSGSSGSGPVNTGGSSTTGGRKTPPNMSPPVLAQQPPPPQPLPAATKGKQSEHPVTPPNEKNLKKWEEWTKFMESPTSNVSSPGPKPVNFDLQRTTQAIVSDPQILHPVPLRVTPVGAEAVDNGSLVYSDANHGLLAVQSTDESSPKQNVQSQPQHQQQHSTPQQQRDSLTNSSDLRAIQRPQSKKPPSKGVGAIPPPPQRESGSNALVANDTSMTISLDAAGFAVATAPAPLTKKSSVDQQQPPPPLPPPRPSAHRHTRSSSLDLNKLKLGTGASVAPLKMPPPPEIPPRVVTPPTADQPSAGTTNHAFADFTHFPTGSIGHRGATAATGEASNITTIHLDAAGNMTNHSTPHRGSGTLPKSLVMHTPRQSAFEVYRKPLTADSARAVRGSQSPQQPPLVTSRSVESSAVVNSSSAVPQGDYDKRISALSDSLRQVRFKSNDPPPVMADALKQLKEQNLLLLRVCNDLSEELLHIQQKREDIRIKIELQEQILGGGNALVTAATGPSSLPTSATHHLSHHHANL